MKAEQNELEKAGEELRGGALAEYWAFLCHNKKWWLLPLLAVMLLFGVLLALSGSAMAPFIYTLF